MTWNADTLAALLTEPESLEDLVAVLDDLPEADRSAIRQAIGKALPSLRRRMKEIGTGGQRLVLLAVAVGATPAQCAKVFSPWDIWRLMQVPITRDRLLSWMTGNGPEWAGDLITRMLKRRTADSMYYTELIDELALTLADVRSGTVLTSALTRLEGRVDSLHVTRLSEAISVALERGTPLADVMRAQAADAREASRRALMEEGGRREIAQMVPVVFLVLPITVVFALFPGLFVLRLGL